MKRKLLTIVASITLCTSFILGACSKEKALLLHQIVKRISLCDEWIIQTFNYKENDGKLVGFDVEIGEALAKR